MRLLPVALVLSVGLVAARAQGTPPRDPERVAQDENPEHLRGGPPNPGQAIPFQQFTGMMKQEIKRAMNGKPYPSLHQWHPLTAREKFDLFLKHTYAGSTFASAAIDAVKDDWRKRNREYERGPAGLAQRYGVELGVDETSVFFEQFLVPAALKQDPRYFRNPELPLPGRMFYSLSRVLVTRTDNGHQTLNASRIVGGAVSQALADLYVPGKRQGFAPIGNRVTLDLVRDAGVNLLHEFWPDLRRKLLHR